jgi:hypothetical protein
MPDAERWFHAPITSAFDALRKMAWDDRLRGFHEFGPEASSFVAYVLDNVGRYQSTLRNSDASHSCWILEPEWENTGAIVTILRFAREHGYLYGPPPYAEYTGVPGFVLSLNPPRWPWRHPGLYVDFSFSSHEILEPLGYWAEH